MSEELFSIVYASAAIQKFSETELVDLLKISRENNIRHDITGLLLYKDGNFIQAIEGPEEAVVQLYQKIQEDSRHHHIITLGRQPIPERQFPDWSMGFRNINNLPEEELDGFSRFLDEDFTPEYFSDNPIRAYIMLLNFKKYM